MLNAQQAFIRMKYVNIHENLQNVFQQYVW